MQLDYKKNCLDIIRLIAAVQVFFGHLVWHFELGENFRLFKIVEIVSTFLPGKGVVIFFAISGFFSIASLDKTKTTGEYWKKKFLRIYPELWLAFAINSILIACIYRTLPSVKDLLLYIITQVTIFQFYTGDWLRGFGVGTPNGALWTITVTIQFYFIVYFLYKISLKWRLKHWLVLLCFSIAMAILSANLTFLPEVVRKLIGVSLIPYFYIFLIGLIVFKFKDLIIPLLKKYLVVIGVLYIVTKFLAIYVFSNIKLGINYDVFSALLLSLFVLGVGFSFGQRRLKYEISYSIFLWHMIICNLFIEMSKKYSLSLNDYGIIFMVMTYLVVLPIAMLSFKFGKYVTRKLEA